MKKLEDIPKNNIYKVPDGYFDRLPGIIQARVAAKEASPAWYASWAVSLRYAIPLVVLVVAGIFWFRSWSNQPINFEAELRQFRPEQVAEYLENNDLAGESDLSTDELVESVNWTKTDVNSLEDSVYATYNSSRQQMEKALDEIDNEL